MLSKLKFSSDHKIMNNELFFSKKGKKNAITKWRKKSDVFAEYDEKEIYCKYLFFTLSKNFHECHINFFGTKNFYFSFNVIKPRVFFFFVIVQ